MDFVGIFDFNATLLYMALNDGTGLGPFNFYYPGAIPFDSASYVSSVTWYDSRPQPSWSDILAAVPAYRAWYLLQTAIRQDAQDAHDLAIAAIVPQVQTDWNASSGLGKVLNKPSLATVATSGAYSDLSGLPAALSQSLPSRSLNTAFQISSSRNAIVNYSAQVASTLSLTAGQSSTISLQISPTNSTYTEISRFINGNTGTLAIGLGLTQTVCGTVMGLVPSGYYAKIVASGSGTNSLIVGQETLL